MKLIDAHLCVQCEEVYERSKEVANKSCPSCGSNTMPLAIGRIIHPLSADAVLPVVTPITMPPAPSDHRK